MLQITGANHRKELLIIASDIQKIPCSELKTLDQLWMKFSNQRFGFSIIVNIYQAEIPFD
ncbi:MAG: GUN4 domain-containing protein [Nostocales cyanobacterium ELA583]|jgi:hypothetical protein